MKIVLDTNCLLQIIFPQSYHKEVLEALVAGRYSVCVTNEILFEYKEIIAKRTGDASFADSVIALLLSLPATELIAPYFRFNLITADPDDNKFVDCAITAGATYVVTNDRHFEELKLYDFPQVDVCSLTEFLRIVRTL